MSLNSIYTGATTLEGYLTCFFAALVLGLLTACAHMYRARHSGSMAVTLALLPAAVQTVIFLVNGSVGVGVAVAGAFSLVRFRSMPGTARDITALFAAMAVGLATGTGHLVVAAVFTPLMAAALAALTFFSFGEPREDEREIRITVPEDLDFEGAFDDMLRQHTKSFRLVRVRTTNMGSLYELTYRALADGRLNAKELMDQLRTRNGNLTVQISRALPAKEEIL